jgi:hypothetical protein
LDKDIVIICSAGRTGTSFFARTLPHIIDGAWCVHEPDVWYGLSSETWQRIRTFGVYHMILGRITGRTGLRNLSQRRLSNCQDLDHLTTELVRQRDRYYRNITSDLIIESNGQWYGALATLPKTGWRYRVVALIRDPRTWVASTLNHGHIFGYRDRVRQLGFRRLDPALVDDNQFADRWRCMSDFQKVCWTWQAINQQLVGSTEKDSRARLYRFEDIFLADDRMQRMEDMIRFITNFGERTYPWHLSPDLLNRRINEADRARFPDWQRWPREHARDLEEICGPLMRRFDYGAEPEWRAKLE